MPSRALPSIGIVSPSFNQGPFIGEMLRSIERQTLKPAEHVLLDPGSKDDSREQIAAYVERHAFARAVFEPDNGQVDAINTGLRACSADVLTWLNTDDFYCDDGALEAVAEAFAEDPELDIVYGRGEFIDPDGRVLKQAYVNAKPETFPETIKHSIGILQPALFFRREVVERAGLLDERWNLSLDYELWMRWISAGVKMRFIDRKIVRAVLHDESKTGGQRGKQYEEIEAHTHEAFGFVPLRWLERHAEYLVAGDDGIVQSGGKGADPAAIDAEINRLQRQWNASAESIQKMAACKDEPEVMRTLADLARRGLLTTSPSRIAVTSFTEPYFRQGLNVIASLGRHAQGVFDWVLVYALGLTDAQRRRLGALHRVIVLDYPAECSSFFDGYFEPKNYGYKCAAIWDAKHAAGEGGTVLWIDAGVALVRPIDEVFGIIERDGIFFVDHDDKPSWPFYNATFTHPQCAEAMDATGAELLGPHLCSCFLGYKVGGAGQQLIDEAYAYSQDPKVVVHSKHPPAQQRREPSTLTQQDRDWLQAALADPASATREQAYAHLPYLGHRQDQTIYSILCARHGFVPHSATRFCWSDDASSKASLANWKSGGEGELTRSRQHPAAMPITALTSHHRGLLDRLDGLGWKRQSDTVFVLGNGPSLREFDFSQLAGFDTIGMNAAYRHWDRINWYPTIYACMDTVVIKSHAHEIDRLIRERRSNGIRVFFLRRAILELCPHLEDEPSVVFFEDVQHTSDLLDTGMITTGSLSALFGGFMGFDRVALLGIDCNYVEKLPEATPGDGHQLVIEKTPDHNPNYFFDDYQQAGDLYNIPNVHPGFHSRSWVAALGLLEAAGVAIVNCNDKSELKAIPMASLESVLGSRPEEKRHPVLIGGEFGRDAKARIEEIDYIADAIGTSSVSDRLIDVGTHRGGSLKPFLEKGWAVLGFEPDPQNRQAVMERFGANPKLTIDPRAVSDHEAQGVVFYASADSSGASSLAAFTAAHEESTSVDVTTLETALTEHDVHRVRLLKVDAEGFDLMVLKGMHWDRIQPDAIMVEFEDRKTKPIGYTTEDMAAYLAERGYHVICSEWHPIIRYGVRHDWRRMFRWREDDLRPDAESWGNLIAFRYKADAEAFEALVRRSIKLGLLTGGVDPAKLRPAQPADPVAPAAQTPVDAPAPSKPDSPWLRRVRELAVRARHAQRVQPAPLGDHPVVQAVLPWAPKALGSMSPAQRVHMAIGKVGRVYFGRAGLMAALTLACWAAGVWLLATGQPAWVAMTAAGAAFIPLFVLIAFIAITARRQSYENVAALQHATEVGIRQATHHQRWQQDEAMRHANGLIAQATDFIEQVEQRRIRTRGDLERAVKTLRADLQQTMSGSLKTLEGKVSAATETHRKEIEQLRQQSELLESLTNQARQSLDDALVRMGRLEGLTQGVAEQSQQSSLNAERRTTEARNELNASIERVRGEAMAAVQRAAESIELVKNEATRQLDDSIRASEAKSEQRSADLVHAISQVRGDAYTQFTRTIGSTVHEGVASLGIELQRGELQYMQRKLQVIEGLCEGRLAGSVDDAIARTLAARTFAGRELKVLEIGVLFGVGAIYMHQLLSAFFDRVTLTLLDPFDGYYGSDHVDPLTGQPVTRGMVERNLRRCSVPVEDVTIIDRFSTEPEALAAAEEHGPYSVVIIDGDHSYKGVKADFDLYAPMLAPGGILIIDDYGSKDWPEVTRFTDESVYSDERFREMAVIGKTAIFVRKSAVETETKPGVSKTISNGERIGGEHAGTATGESASASDTVPG